MIFPQKEFDRRLKIAELALILVGMSNVGKTYWTARLASEKGFRTLSIDVEIERRLGLSGIEEVSRWMGPPYESRYPEAEKRYLEAEEEVMRSIEIPAGKSFVVDSTGSLIYHPPSLLESLKKRFLVVHLDVPDTQVEEMTEKFFAHPKPVIWKGMFSKRPGESPEAALRRCYPEWLSFRLKKYRSVADVSLATFDSREGDTSGFLQEIRKRL